MTFALPTYFPDGRASGDLGYVVSLGNYQPPLCGYKALPECATMRLCATRRRAPAGHGPSQSRP
jgi:hypothetical protein